MSEEDYGDDDKSLTGREDIDHQDHYERYSIQPIDFIEENDLSFHQGNIVKYVCRYRYKGGVDDLYKALWYLKRLINLEEDNNNEEDEGNITEYKFDTFSDYLDYTNYNMSNNEGIDIEDWYISNSCSFSDFTELKEFESDGDEDDGLDPLLSDLKDEKLLELLRWVNEEIGWMNEDTQWESGYYTALEDVRNKIKELLEDE